MKILNEILLIDKLRKEHKLTAEEYKILLECQDSNCLSYLQKQAQEEALSRFGNRVFIRGLIEVTNRCKWYIDMEVLEQSPKVIKDMVSTPMGFYCKY